MQTKQEKNFHLSRMDDTKFSVDERIVINLRSYLSTFKHMYMYNVMSCMMHVRIFEQLTMERNVVHVSLTIH